MNMTVQVDRPNLTINLCQDGETVLAVPIDEAATIANLAGFTGPGATLIDPDGRELSLARADLRVAVMLVGVGAEILNRPKGAVVVRPARTPR